MNKVSRKTKWFLKDILTRRKICPTIVIKIIN